jgi:hypothetical protein
MFNVIIRVCRNSYTHMLRKEKRVSLVICLFTDTPDVSPQSFDVTRNYGGRECVSGNALIKVLVRVLLITVKYCALVIMVTFSILYVMTSHLRQ